jgi:hypothetical protein
MRALRLAVVLGLLPTWLHAAGPTSFVRYSGICFGNAFSTCASINLSTFTAPGGHTLIEVEIRNLNGQIPQATSGQWFSELRLSGRDPAKKLAGATFEYPDDFTQIVRTAAGGFLGSVHRGPVGGGAGWIGGGWDNLCDPNAPPAWQLGDCSKFHEQLWVFTELAGCNTPAVSPLTAQTCDAAGFTGSVVYRFDVATKVTIGDIGIWAIDENSGDFSCQGFLIAPGGRTKCQVAGTVTISPEPETWLLMVTGLVALVVVGRRRRKAAAGS